MQDNNGAAENAKFVIPRGIRARGLSRELPSPKASRKPVYGSRATIARPWIPR
ncbi:hypothetical protein TRIATDRAFT_257427 [Trichoderma atroviride IMI 206040]|uniref:Uncharacterized protein n=1 Tax=Hypocrea atroviridis (strain ATCC 20476 / IMI 206040) TaxID=452589 RepID=G9NX49_HYPAI|nr:uncharacterized protein TRIATDRAFT_257427 [Trichoderma atroviride IMI 206040]EHK45481.1 hypothetical protein TRIATDRAFT_257427 [Trichoderma atroviride IMI 206040]